ncbi:large subunit ribosomal protein L37Ae [Babesia microti strain RI]|uniref:Large subunit ribosomal protein L37Ae n=1 Tax=Babesia microti (strain RI) TaxID=1133968 RepID=A0A0K3APZ6_BABMR|nr:large subunit ribosomal protein L37Ae [Babesia microti strain RI]CTQ41557.1 large subunit ribosomal protein L37Ae [Babesia microti strain RI]|eukprot:XP_012649568.1 large subunit ribosomal protein L37Ae [Babesia microti strain RI]
MAKRTKKVGLTGKYGVRYGASLRKQMKKIELQQHAKYMCPFCCKNSIKWKAVGIWYCKSCNMKIAGGAWSITTPAANAVKSTIVRLNKQRLESA